MELKVAEPTDVHVLLPLVRHYHAFEQIEMSDADRFKAFSPLLGENSLGQIWLIFSSEQVVGYIALCYGYSIEFGGRDAFVDEFFIEAPARGQGLGRSVLDAIKSEAAKQGIVALHLEVARTNRRAKALYAHLGFEARDHFHLMSCFL
ncbi:MAG: GNAT family N-acetyltransferase [Anaerolineae bacterium]|nr:GNAT family N-acetyltransferase [Anaerolineae bacterium]